MGFQLVIAEGKEAGREFVFEQDSVLIGRTSDCDVVLYDPGVSRKHARIYSESDGYFVEDMGSSNGTKVNGAIIKKKQLSDGDAISLGPVVFNFAALAMLEEATDSQATPAQQGGSTRIVSSSDVERRRSKGRGSALAPEGAGEAELHELSRSSTRTIQAVREQQAISRRTSSGAKPAPRNGASSSSSNVQASAPRRSMGASSTSGGGGLSAAERARIRRQSGGPAGAMKIMWADANVPKRIGIVLGLTALAAGMFGAVIYYAFMNGPVVVVKPEPTALFPSQPVEESFGYGPDVNYERTDQKVFDFEFKSPVRTVVVLHFQAKDISEKEVEISVNGQAVGFVPADTLAVNERSNEALVPPAALVRNGNNKIIFDNVKNPPGKDNWRIWNIWVEVFPLPEGTREEMLKLAQENSRRGQDFWDRRSIGAENLYKAWRSFRDAWLTLESIEGTKPLEYVVARNRMHDSQQELDKRCSQLLLEAQSAYNQKRFDEARMTLEHVNEYFPKKDQPCPFRAEQLREFYGL
jgi:hypothetical protein